LKIQRNQTVFKFFEQLANITAKPPAGYPPNSLISFYRYFLAEHKRLFLALFTVGLGVALADAMMPVFIGQLVSLVAAQDRAMALDQAWPKIALMLAVILIARPAIILLDLLLRNNALVPVVTSRMRWLSHRLVVRQEWRFFQNDHAGRIASRVMQTPGSLRESTEAAVRAVWYILMYGTTTLVLLSAADWRLALPTLLWFVAYAGMLRHFVPRLRIKAGENAEAHSTLMGRVVDSYSNILTVKLFAKASQEDAFVLQAIEGHDLAQRNHMRLITQFMFALTLLNTLLIAATALVGIALWRFNLIDPGAVAMALPLTWQITTMAGWVAWEITGIFENIATVQEGMQTIAAPVTLIDAPNAEELKITQGAIQFDQVSFGYGENPVFDSFNLTIRAGERVGIVGRSGAGKSTLVSLLLRLFDCNNGHIRIDGQDIALVTQDSLRAAIGVVSQDTALLHRSVGENILYGRPDANREQVTQAITQAKASLFIEELTDHRGLTGLDAAVGERGVKLSGGQRQRIGIARVLLKDAPILILDEATSALDSEAEQAIQEQLSALMNGKTVITIAHRLSTLMQMDRILVLDNGKIIDEGTHAELAGRDGLYAQFWEHQAGGNSLFNLTQNDDPSTH
jgi:ATP-binding cassette, subfamily B, multidrug efflux pump